MSSVRIDTSVWPVVLSVFNGRQTASELEAYIRQMDAIYDRGEPYIGATLMLRFRNDLAQARRLAEWTRARLRVVEKTCRCAAIVAPSAGFRFVFSTFLMLQPLPMPYTVVADVDAASDWIEARFGPGSDVRAPARL